MADIDALGHAIAAAFVATMFGIFTGYVMWHPFSNKLKLMSKEEVELKRAGITIKAYPALIDRGEDVSIIGVVLNPIKLAVS